MCQHQGHDLFLVDTKNADMQHLEPSRGLDVLEIDLKRELSCFCRFLGPRVVLAYSADVAKQKAPVPGLRDGSERGREDKGERVG